MGAFIVCRGNGYYEPASTCDNDACDEPVRAVFAVMRSSKQIALCEQHARAAALKPYFSQVA